MTIKEFFESNEKLAIHCNTIEKAKKLLKAFDDAGYTWIGGERYIARSRWNFEKENTCYSNAHKYCDIYYYQDNEFTILEFEDIEI